MPRRDPWLCGPASRPGCLCRELITPEPRRLSKACFHASFRRSPHGDWGLAFTGSLPAAPLKARDKPDWHSPFVMQHSDLGHTAGTGLMRCGARETGGGATKGRRRKGHIATGTEGPLRPRVIDSGFRALTFPGMVDTPGGSVSESILAFGGFELDLGRQQLRRDGRPVALNAQPLKVLAFLATHPDEVITREVLQRHVWGDVLVEYDQGINACIRQIRA